MNRKTFWAGLVTAVIWASAFPGIRAGLKGYAPPELVLLRFTVASLALFTLCARKTQRWPERADLPRLAALGFLGITAYQIFLNYGQLTVASGTASMIINTAPIWAAIFAWIFRKETLTPLQMGGVALGFLGVLVLTLGQHKALGGGTGVYLVLLAALAHSGSFLLQKPLLEKYSPLIVTAFALLFGALPLLPWAPSTVQAIRHAPWPASAAVIYLGLFPAALAYLFWNRVLSELTISKAAGFLYLIPPISLALGWLWHGEVPTLVSVAGGTVALLGVAVVLGKPRPMYNRTL